MALERTATKPASPRTNRPMTDQQLQDAARRFILYFDPAVLASYRQESHRYEVATDNFEGSVRTRSDFYQTLSEEGRRDSNVAVDFGFRAKADGNLAIAAWGLDVAEKTAPAERKKWMPFAIPADSFPAEFDERFRLWMRRHIAGDWDVGNGPLQRLLESVSEINAVAVESVGLPLFTAGTSADLLFPAADNDAAYAASHAALYHFIIDGLSKDAMELLAPCLDVPGGFDNRYTVRSLKKLVTDPSIHTIVFGPLELVSEKRRQSDHGARARSSPFPAFDRF